MQHRAQHDRDRRAEIDHGPHVRVVQDARRVPQVTLDRADPRRRAQQGPRVRDDDRVVIDVDHARPRVQLARDLVDIARGGQPRADVDELPDARLVGQEPDGAAQETPVRPRRCPRIGHHGQQLAGGLPVFGVVVLAAEQVVVDAAQHRAARAAVLVI